MVILQTVFTWENGKLIQKEWPLKDKAAGEAVYERELKGDLLITVSTTVQNEMI